MRDDFDSELADRFKVLDHVPVPDTWSRVLDHMHAADTSSPVQFTEEVVTMIDVKTTDPTEPRQERPMRVVVAGILAAAAAVVAIAFVVIRDADDVTPADEPSLAALVNPLVDIRPELVNRGNIELFTVATDTPRYLALTALVQFDGTHWSTVPEDTRPASGTLGQAPQNAELVTQRITIGNLGGVLAPAARTATSAAWQGPNLLWANEAGALYVDGGLKPNFQYQVTSADNFPTPEQLRTATVDGAPDPIYYDLPRSLPSEIRTLAQDVTALATTPYDKAIALQNWFRANFEYSLTVQRGHSNDAMLDFLSIKKGYCEQFSATFAAMARSIGLPTRVIVGFTQGILRSDGLYHVAGRHAHSWDEVWFDGYGWVQFDPTPGRGAPGADDTDVDADQQAAP